MYAELERRQNQDILALGDLESSLDVLDKVGKVLEVALGIADIDVSQPHGFVDLGGDSLGAAALSGLIEDVFGVALAVNSILSPAGNPQQWAKAIEAALGRTDSRLATFDEIHGTRIHAGAAPRISTSTHSSAGTASSACPQRNLPQSRTAFC